MASVTIPNVPGSTVAPVVTAFAGLGYVNGGAGESLTATSGTWNGSPTNYSYKWYSCSAPVSTAASALPNWCNLIPNETNSNLLTSVTLLGTYIIAGVTATNVAGSTTIWTTTSPLVVQPAWPTISPSLSGTARVGLTLIANPGTWTGHPTPSISYKWFKCTTQILSAVNQSAPNTCALISNQITANYIIQASDIGYYILSMVSGSYIGYVTQFLTPTSATVFDVYTISFVYNGATGGASPASSNYTTGLSAMTLPTPTRTGYTFSGWYSDISLTISIGNAGETYTPTATGSAYAKWSAATYTVTYLYNGADGGESTVSTNYTTGGTVITLPTPTRTGYTFSGWYSDIALTTSIGIAGASYTPTSSGSGYAKWIGITYTITFFYNGATCCNSPYNISRGTSVSTFTTGSVPLSFPTLIKLGYDLDGWYSDIDFINFIGLARDSFAPTSSGSAYAKWVPGTYTVTYVYSNADGGASKISDTYTTGGSVIFLPTPTRTGYTFSGWYSDSGLTSFLGDAGSSYTPTASGLIYVKWVAKTYVITYIYNNATSGTSTLTSTSIGASPISLPTPLRAGYAFSGWYLDSGFANYIGDAGGSYVPVGNASAYAKWVPGTFTVAYIYNDATSGSSTLSDTFTTGTFAIVLPTPLRTGYTFAGWYSNSGFTNFIGDAGGSYSPTLSGYGYAKWIQSYLSLDSSLYFAQNYSTTVTVTPSSIFSGTVTITPHGAGLSTPTILNFQSSSLAQIFSVTPTMPGMLTLEVANAGGFINPSNVLFSVQNEWLTNNVAPNSLAAIASSRDGSTLAAGGTAALYTSGDQGKTWVTRPRVGAAVQSITSSTDGSHFAGCGGGRVDTSSDFGVTWTWQSLAFTCVHIASSGSGSRVVARGYNGGVYISENFGQTWTQKSLEWGYGYLGTGISLTKDGNVIYASVRDPSGSQCYFCTNLMISADFGTSWTFPKFSLVTNALASNSDGSQVILLHNNRVNKVVIDTATSGTVSSTYALVFSSTYYNSGASSSDDGRVLAVLGVDGLTISNDFGVTWIFQYIAYDYALRSLAVSGDGKNIFVTTTNGVVLHSANSW